MFIHHVTLCKYVFAEPPFLILLLEFVMSPKNNVSFACWNIDGLYQRIAGQRICKLEDPNVQTMLRKFDLIGLVETHCGNNDNPILEDYQVICNNRPKGLRAPKHFGGIALCIKNSVRKGIKILQVTNSEFMWVKLDKQFFNMESDLYIAVVYVSPPSSPFTARREDIFELLESDISKYSKLGRCLLAGDFNARTHCELDYSLTESFHDRLNHRDLGLIDESPLLPVRCSKDTHKVDEPGTQLLSLCKVSGLHILNGRTLGDYSGECTCYSHTGAPSVIDYMLLSIESRNMVEYFHVHNITPMSIHCMLSILVRTNMYNPENIQEALEPLGTQYKWKKTDDLKFQVALNSEKCQNIIGGFLNCDIGSITVSEATQVVTNIYETAANIAGISKRNKVKKRYKRKQFKKWYDGDCRLSYREIISLGRTLRQNPFDRELLNKLRCQRKNYKRLLKKKKSLYKQNIMNRIEALESKDPASFWKLIDELGALYKESNVAPISAERWVNYFSDLMKSASVEANSQADKRMEDFIRENKDRIFNELNFKIADREVLDAIAGLKSGKAAGKDKILNEMIKAGSAQLLSVLTKLFNKLLNLGAFPDQWRYNSLTPIYKNKGDKQSTENYRGIAVGSNLSKLFCAVLQRRLIKYLEGNNVIPHNQIGFKPKARTSDHILTLKSVIDKVINKMPRAYLFVCFVDLKKAFDSISRQALIFKMVQVGIGGNFINIIRDMYAEVYYCVKLKEGYSSSFDSSVGVKQGCALSPTLFNIYMYDLPNIFRQNCDPIKLNDVYLNCLMFADDLVLLSSSDSGLQKCLNSLKDYCAQWQLTVNLNKTKVIIFNKGGHKVKRFVFWYDGNTIEVVNEYCYLGIMFTASGTFKAAITDLSTRARRALFKLKQFDVRSNVALSLKLFDSLVMPVMRYGSEVWAAFCIKGLNECNFLQLCDKLAIEKIHVQFCKYLLGVGKKATNAAVKAELGRSAVLIELLGHCAKYWLRLCTLDTTSLVYNAYIEMYSDISCNNWYSCIKSLWTEFGLYNVLENHGSLYKHKIIRILKNNMYARYEHHWLAQVGLSPTLDTPKSKLRTYIKFKQSIGLENYLLAVKCFKKRQYMTRLRISAHDLRIESGRYCRPPLPTDSRLCMFCESGCVENEEHFIMDCSLYEEERNDFIKNISELSPHVINLNKAELFKIILTMYNGDVEFINVITNYVHSCFCKRTEYGNRFK